jgi:NADPH2:quinone reductase
VRAVTFRDETVTVQEHPDPQPRAGELLVRVRAAGLNGADRWQLARRPPHYPPPPTAPPDIPGLEIAGEVVACGDGTTRFRVGDRVMAIVIGGGQAELCVVHERHAMPVPSGVDWPAAGGLPEVFITAYDALFTRCAVKAGERLLVNGAAGGVGTAAVQLAAAVGAHVTATVRAAALRGAVQALGADVVSAPGEFAEHGPFDVVLELVGVATMPENLQALAIDGRIALVGAQVGDDTTVALDALSMMRTRATVTATTIRRRTLEEKAMMARALERHVLPLFERGRLRVPIAESFPLADASRAYDRFARGAKLGKVILEL